MAVKRLKATAVLVPVLTISGSNGMHGSPVKGLLLQHGDLLQWASLLAGRELVLRNVAGVAGDATWLVKIVELLGIAGVLELRDEVIGQVGIRLLGAPIWLSRSVPSGIM